MEDLIGGIIAFLVFLGLSIPIIIIGLIYYLKKRLEHKQIMAAIEKGTPLSELRPPKPKLAGPLWIKCLTTGIVLLAIALGFAFAGPDNLVLFVAFVLGGVGTASIVRALLYRKYQPQIQPSDKNNRAESKNAAGASTPESSQSTNE